MKTFKSLFLSAFLLCAIEFASHAQVVTGGTLGVDYRNDGYFIELAPKIGYKYSIFESGVAPFLSYHESSDYLAYGIQVYTQADIYKGVFLHAEFSATSAYIYSQGTREWVMGLPVGVGYQHEISDGLWFKGSVLYDFLYKEGFSPTKNPIFRVGLTYSL